MPHSPDWSDERTRAVYSYLRWSCESGGAKGGRSPHVRQGQNVTTRIEATYRVVTPLFCAGADQRRAELRLPSFKGVLRFWWRALAWSRLDGNLHAIREQEDWLFGSAGGGQSRLSMHLSVSAEPKAAGVGTVLEVAGNVVGEGARYLGYGVMEAFPSRQRGTRAGQLIRPCLRAPLDFTIRIRGRGLADEPLNHLRDALLAVGVLGGMGAKSRKGYGSLAIQSLRVDDVKQWQAPQSVDDLRDRIKALRYEAGPSGWPEFTALCAKTRHVLVRNAKNVTAMELLNLVGREMMRYRSWGHDGQVLGESSERNFTDDHDLMESPHRNAHPRRVVFGLPHNYDKHARDQVGPHDRNLDRRASPLFIHVHPCGATPVAVLSFLPARFLPDGRNDISVGGSRVRQTAEGDLYRPLHDFLDRLLDRERCREPLTAEEVRR